MSSKKRSGKKNLGLTRNQKRKLEYAKKMEKDRAGSEKPQKARVTVKTKLHPFPCGNPACNKCYTRTIGQGITQRPDQAK